MTCIAALVDKGEVWMGADSYTGGSSIRVSKHSKIFRLHSDSVEMIIGSSGLARTAQILRYHLALPDIEKPYRSDFDALEYMVTKFIPAYRNCLCENGRLEKDKEIQVSSNDFVVGFKNRLFYIDTAFYVNEVEGDICCAGSGEQYAYGAIHATIGKAPYERIMSALKAANYFNSTVSEPFIVETLSGNIKTKGLKV